MEKHENAAPMQESMGAMQAAAEGLKEFGKGMAGGLGAILDAVGPELGRMGVQGQAELAAALFSESNAYVPYGRGQNPAEKDGVEAQKAEPQHEQPQQEYG